MKKFFFPAHNGVRCYNKNVYAQSYIEKSQNKMCSGKTKNKIIFWDFPFFRGFQYFFFGFIAFFATLFNINSCDEKCEDKKVKNKKIKKSNSKSEKNAKKTQKTEKNLRKNIDLSKFSWVGFGYFVLLFIVFVGGVLLLGFVPAKLGWLIVDERGSFFLRNLLIAFLKLLFYFLILSILRVLPFMQDFYRFNGASNQASVGSENVNKNRKLDYFSPLNFLNYIVFVFALDIFVVTLIGANFGFLFNLLISLAVLLCVISISYEILYLLEKSKYQAVKNISLITNFFVTCKPRLTHEELAVACLMEAGLLQTQKGRKNMQKTSENKSFSSMYAEMKTRLLKVQGVEIADLDWIIATVLNKNRAEIKLVSEVTEKQYNDISKAVNRRAKHEPLSSIFGFVDFYGIKFNVNKKVLSPRMDTEILVSEALKIIKTIKKPSVLDLGTGSGAIAITIAKNSHATVTAVDISSGALDVASQNAKNNDAKVTFLQSDLFNSLKKHKGYDIIISNPPYIKSGDIKKLDEEVKKYDPELALNGGEDGLDFYRKITSQAKQFLNKNGYLMFEVGKGQATEVKNLMKKEGYVDIKVIKDYGKIDRVVYGKCAR